MEVYIQGKSKAEINRRLLAGEVVMAKEYTPTTVTLHRVNELREGTLVKVHKSVLHGEPTPATAYGVVRANRVS